MTEEERAWMAEEAKRDFWDGFWTGISIAMLVMTGILMLTV